MKKTLMVLSFALCASLAFAQTKAPLTPKNMAKGNVAVSRTVIDNDAKAGFTGSIFTKTDPVFTCDFATAGVGYTTGEVGANEMVNGEVIAQHAQTRMHAHWNRIADTSEATRLALAEQGEWPVTFDATDPSYRLTRGFASPTANAGLMIMTMQDQIAGWGGTGIAGTFDAYVAFNPISTTGIPLVHVYMYQHIRKFNSDHCYIDYSTNGTTWGAVEFNVKGVDVNSNSQIRGFVKIPLPTSLGNQSTVYMRVRWCSESNSGGAYGYFWMFDDFTVLPNPDVELRVKANRNFDGLYGLMPQNMNLPIVWAGDVINFGSNALTNVNITVSSFMDGENATVRANNQMGTLASDPMSTTTVVIDPQGYYDVNAEDHGETPLGDSSAAGTTGYLPTTNTGLGHYFANIECDQFDMVYGDTATFDTMAYTVNHDATYHNGKGVWGRDNGALRKFSYYAHGLSDPANHIYSTDPDNTPWDHQGYGAFVQYFTSNTIPAGWRILGVEMVASTTEGMNGNPANGIARIYPWLYKDSANYFVTQSTGASAHTITADEILTGEDFTDLTYLTYGEYPTVFIPFPNQPEIAPNTNYWIGYRLAEDCGFAVATNGNYFYTLTDSSAQYFYNTEGMQSYSWVVRPSASHSGSVVVYDPTGTDYNIWSFTSTEYPMIRMVVGPGFYVPKVAVSFECNEEEGFFADDNYNSLCGSLDSVPVGGSASWYILPAEEYQIDKVYLDGVETEDYTLYEEEDGSTYGIIELTDIQVAHTLSATFKNGIGIDQVSGVSMKLQPNPATSAVNISMKGVNGNVNMALIDMSGRVITTSQFNAENGTTINVSNLAKGAYFVRISNDKFSKVEKLIVR